MAEPALLFDIAMLEVALKAPDGTLADDPYTLLIARMASEKVRSVAEQPTWVAPDKEPLVEPESHAPWRASDIAIHVAKRAWQDRGNLQRRTSGPISETFFEGGVRGLGLEPDETEWLRKQVPGGNSNGMWVMGHYGTRVSGRHRYGDETPDGYSFLGGDWNFAHGMDMRGPADADSW